MIESWVNGGGGEQVRSPKAHPGQGRANSPHKADGMLQAFGPWVSSETTPLPLMLQKQPRSLWKPGSPAPFQSNFTNAAI